MEQAVSNNFSPKTALILSVVLFLAVSVMNTWHNIIIVQDDQFNDSFYTSSIVVKNAASSQGITSPHYVKNVSALNSSFSNEVLVLEEQTNMIASNNNSAPGSVLKKEAETLSLVEAYSPTLNQGINKEDISGEIATENGQIKSLSFSIPGQDSFELADIKVEGNLFRFQKDGVDIQGMVYPISNTAYLVNFITGPMQGMRLRFNSEEAEAQQQEYALKMQEDHQRMQEEAAANAQEAMASKSIASEGSSPVVVAPDQSDVSAERIDPDYERAQEVEVAY